MRIFDGLQETRHSIGMANLGYGSTKRNFGYKNETFLHENDDWSNAWDEKRPECPYLRLISRIFQTKSTNLRK